MSNTSDSGFAQDSTADNSSRSADRVYQTVTIAAILLLLGTLWVF
jgi:hypothetical protein